MMETITRKIFSTFLLVLFLEHIISLCSIFKKKYNNTSIIRITCVIFHIAISLSHVSSLKYRRSAASIFLLLFIVNENTSNFRPEFTSVSVDVRRTSGCRVWVRANKADVQRGSEDLSVKAGFPVCGMADLRKDDSAA